MGHYFVVGHYFVSPGVIVLADWHKKGKWGCVCVIVLISLSEVIECGWLVDNKTQNLCFPG